MRRTKAGATGLRVEGYTLPAAELGPENPLPHFRARQEHGAYQVAPLVSEEDRKYFGWCTGFRILPYRMQDGYQREKKNTTFPSVVLENEVLRATFLPAFGGRLMSLFHKPSSRELLDRNPVLQFANVALRNAWFSGGIEWNLGQPGHHFLTCAPVFAARIRGREGSPGMRIYEWDRCKGLAWQIDFHLPPGSPFLYATVRVVNPTPREVAMYWWTNLAVPEAPGVRTLAPAGVAFANEGQGRIGLARLPVINKVDVTYATNLRRSAESFYRLNDGCRPWVATLDDAGRGIVETSTAVLRGRKMFVWGMNPGGRRWQEYLSLPGRAYIEIQAGLARTQMESLPMPAGASWSWTESFGLLEADPQVVHGEDWEAAWRCAEDALEAVLPHATLQQRHAEFVAELDAAPDDVLMTGSGWGALERRRLAADRQPDLIPAAMVFSESTLGDAQAPWLSLLDTKVLPERGAQDDPGEWMIQPEWEQRLAASVDSGAAGHWGAHLHLGVMRAERFDFSGARAAWQDSLACRPSCWALRNLAQLKKTDKHYSAAADLIMQAWVLVPGLAQLALAKECLEILTLAKRQAEALKFIRSLPAPLRDHERIQLTYARLALETGELDAVEQVLRREFYSIREGEMALTDLWFAMWERRVAAAEGVSIDDALRARVRRDHPPPARIDFRHG